jgi:hypothetical protein
VTFWDGGYAGGTVISYITVQGGPYVMEVNSASGNIPCDHVVATGLTLPYGGIHSCAGLSLIIIFIYCILFIFLFRLGICG